MGISWPMNIEFGTFVNLMDHEEYLMIHEMQLFDGEKISWWREKFMAMKNFSMVAKKIHGHEKLFHGSEKISWPWKTYFMGCEKDSYIIHWKFMAINQGHEIESCYIHDHEKRFMGFSWTFHGIFIELMLVVIRKFSISFQDPKFFNSLSSEIRNATSTASFCCKLKAFLLS